MAKTEQLVAIRLVRGLQFRRQKLSSAMTRYFKFIEFVRWNEPTMVPWVKRWVKEVATANEGRAHFVPVRKKLSFAMPFKLFKKKVIQLLHQGVTNGNF